MKYCVVVFDEEMAQDESPPFITARNAPESYILNGIIVFGPYNTISEASGVGRKLEKKYSWAVRGCHPNANIH